MASYSNNLNLLMKDPLTEGNDTFNIETMLNENWRKIDAIGNPAELWVWEKTLYTPQSYELGEVIERVVLVADSHYANGKYYEYADAIHVNEDGSINLINPTSATVTYNDNYASVLLGKYIKTFSSTPDKKLSSKTVYYIPVDCSLNSSKNVVANGTTYTYGVTASKVQRVIGAAEIITHVSYLTSLDSEAYLEDGQSGGYWYTRLGQIGDTVRIEYGSYIGTGTYGSENPNSLSFDFAPKLFSILCKYDLANGMTYSFLGDYYLNSVIDPQTFLSETYRTRKQPSVDDDNQVVREGYGKRSSDGKTITWYNAQSERYQNNNLDYKYYYIAIG